MEQIEKDLTIFNRTDKRGNIYEEIKVRATRLQPVPAPQAATAITQTTTTLRVARVRGRYVSRLLQGVLQRPRGSFQGAATVDYRWRGAGDSRAAAPSSDARPPRSCERSSRCTCVCVCVVEFAPAMLAPDRSGWLALTDYDRLIASYSRSTRASIHKSRPFRSTCTRSCSKSFCAASGARSWWRSRICSFPITWRSTR